MFVRPATPQTSAIGALMMALLCAAYMASVSGIVELDRMLALAESRYGADGVKAVAAWGAFLADSTSLSTRAQLRETNDYFNQRIRFSTDADIYGTEDYWATPLETLGMASADCEDFSIAKYATLLNLGVDPRSLRLVYVKARLPGGASQAHMVLAWYEAPGAEPLILDNLNTALLPASQRRDLTPIFSFNADDLWVSGTARPSSAKPQARLSRWRQVLDRMADEGLRGNW